MEPTPSPRSVLVVGGGPAGMELAGLLAERGHRVQLWERDGALGGQLAIAARATINAKFAEWIDWQVGRLARAGVEVRLGCDASAADVLGAGADVVALATGARPRRPDIAGIELPFVHNATDVLAGSAPLGNNVVVIAEDDRGAPLAVADHLAGLGHRLTVIYQSNAPSPLVGKYTVGALLARLDERGVTMISMTRLVGIEPGAVRVANVYSGRRWSIDGVDSVVLACGAVADDGLFHAVRAAHPNAHLLGDAYAPRRMVFATRQAFDLATLIE